MKKQKIHSYRLETSSLSSLNTVLTNARRAVPPRVANKDASDELALSLIHRMRSDHKQQFAAVRRAAQRARAGAVYHAEEMVKANVG